MVVMVFNHIFRDLSSLPAPSSAVNEVISWNTWDWDIAVIGN
jgi:hypothetical protein